MTRIISHTDNGYEQAESPFDAAIQEVAWNDPPVRIVCPYIGLAYIEGLLAKVDDWRLLTDVNAWMGLYHGDKRLSILQFIEQHNDRIHHLPKLHAKCVIGESTAFFGSANLTQTGVAKRDELSVLLEDEYSIRELHQWFKRLWSEGDEIDMDELDQVARSKSASTIHSRRDVPSVSSSARTVNARITTPIGLGNEVQLNEDDEDLVERVALAPDEDWAVSFFQLAKVVLSTVALPENDSRLVTSMAQGDRFGIAVNNRYVLGAFFNDPASIGFILPEEVDDVDRLIEQSSSYYRYKPLAWEGDDVDTPHWIEFTDRPEEILTEDLRRDWLSASLRETKRASRSPYLSSHDDRVYQLIMDEEYQQQILSSAF